MNPPAAIRSLREAARIIQNSRHLVVFTGAGISVPSGIPDFRSPSTGLWQKNDPMQVASLSAFLYHPDRFFAWLKPLLQTVSQAVPNSAHTNLATLQAAGKVAALVTQNIDTLHQQAGSKDVLPLHGTLEKLRCLHCSTTFPAEQYLVDFLQQYILPSCPQCSRYLKPDIVLFEEMLPMEIWTQAEEEMVRADVILVAGTSLDVTPASHLPHLALQNGARLIINTLSPTHLDAEADVLLPYNVVDILPMLTEMVLNE